MTARAMCPSTDCPARNECFRNPGSGTKPWEPQAWSMFQHDKSGRCDYFM